MKSALGFLAVLLASISALAQGEVNFANTSTTLITTNTPLGSGPMSGVNAYRIGLYVGPVGTPASSLTLAGLATNLPSPAVAGRFNANPQTSFFQVPGYEGGFQITFQVRAWSLWAGTFDEAQTTRDALWGVSQLGVAHLGADSLPGVLFRPTSNPDPLGNYPVPGFAMGIPEPKTHVLAVLGAVVLFLCCGRRSHKK